MTRIVSELTKLLVAPLVLRDQNSFTSDVCVYTGRFMESFDLTVINAGDA